MSPFAVSAPSGARDFRLLRAYRNYLQLRPAPQTGQTRVRRPRRAAPPIRFRFPGHSPPKSALSLLEGRCLRKGSRSGSPRKMTTSAEVSMTIIAKCHRPRTRGSGLPGRVNRSKRIHAAQQILDMASQNVGLAPSPQTLPTLF